ncbi:MAG: glycosyltransferase [Thermoanaerobaculia bacterium]|nr:glycosyltransferase [Thermoanaerobaculia bacterium]
MSPSVSVLLPVRDAERTLPTCLRSLERQTLRDFEIVVVDDGSTDGTPTVLNGWMRREPRLRVVRTEARGLVPALNEGLHECRAPFVARMDADDAMLPARLAKQSVLLSSDRDLGVVSCRVRCFPKGRIAGGFRHYESWLNRLQTPEEHRAQRFVESPVAHPSVMFRTDLVRRVGGYRSVPETDPWPEDYDLWLRLLEDGVRFTKVPEILHLWRDRDDRLTRSDPRYGKDRFVACKAHFLARGPLSDRPPVVVWGAGQTGRRLVKALARECRVPEAFVDIDPKKVGRRPYGIPVHRAEELSSLLQPHAIVLVAVSRRGAPEMIRPKLAEAGLVEGRSAFFAA